jgi:hypothetical protein
MALEKCTRQEGSMVNSGSCRVSAAILSITGLTTRARIACATDSGQGQEEEQRLSMFHKTLTKSVSWRL